MNSESILITDDEPGIRLMFRTALELDGCNHEPLLGAYERHPNRPAVLAGRNFFGALKPVLGWVSHLRLW